MEYTQLGATGLKVSRLCFGCMSFGDPTKLHVAKQLAAALAGNTAWQARLRDDFDVRNYKFNDQLRAVSEQVGQQRDRVRDVDAPRIILPSG